MRELKIKETEDVAKAELEAMGSTNGTAFLGVRSAARFHHGEIVLNRDQVKELRDFLDGVLGDVVR